MVLCAMTVGSWQLVVVVGGTTYCANSKNTKRTGGCKYLGYLEDVGGAVAVVLRGALFTRTPIAELQPRPRSHRPVATRLGEEPSQLCA